MKVLVTGGAGFIGSHLVDRLIEERYQVIVVDDLSTGKKEHLNPAAMFYRLDILDPKLEQVFKKEKPELLYHYAAQKDVRKSVEDPAADAQTNIIGFIRLLEFSVKNRVRRVIFASSGGAVYGDQALLPTPEEHPTRPTSPYGISKLTSELYLFYYQQIYGLSYAALRFSNVYGPRQAPDGEAGVVAIFANKLLRGEQPVINGNGMQTRDYVFVKDVVEASMSVFNSNTSDTFNIGTGQETSVNALFQLLVEQIGLSMKPVYGSHKKGEQLRSCLDCNKIAQQIGWIPSVSLKEGIVQTIDAFRREKK